MDTSSDWTFGGYGKPPYNLTLSGFRSALVRDLLATSPFCAPQVRDLLTISPFCSSQITDLPVHV